MSTSIGSGGSGSSKTRPVLPFDLNSVLSPWSYTIRDMLDISRFGYEYVRSSFFMPVGVEAPIGRFVSAPIKIELKARGFKKGRDPHALGSAVDALMFRPGVSQPAGR